LNEIRSPREACDSVIGHTKTEPAIASRVKWPFANCRTELSLLENETPVTCVASCRFFSAVAHLAKNDEGAGIILAIRSKQDYFVGLENACHFFRSLLHAAAHLQEVVMSAPKTHGFTWSRRYRQDFLPFVRAAGA
jgi:hypothetical protein